MNIFAVAYVRPTYDIGDNNRMVPFALNYKSDVPSDIRSNYDFDAAATEADPDFWTIYLLSAYQHSIQEDGDVNTELFTSGIVDTLNGQGASIFFETHRDLTKYAAANNIFFPLATYGYISAHEVGHLFNARHQDYDDPNQPNAGIMEGARALTTRKFTRTSLNKIRSISHP